MVFRVSVSLRMIKKMSVLFRFLDFFCIKDFDKLAKNMNAGNGNLIL